MNGLGRRGATVLQQPTRLCQFVRWSNNQAGDFWKNIAQKYYPTLPPVQHIPDKNVYIPRDEGEATQTVSLPQVDYNFKLNVRYPKVLPNYRPVKPKPPPPRVLNNGKAAGLGKRKTAVAIARVKPGTGKWEINKSKNLLQYFQSHGSRDIVLHPYVTTETLGGWDTWVKVQGGGVNAQAEAIRMAIARALTMYDSGYSATLRKAGFFKRDTRQVERKKPGQKKARKKFQWVKR